ncbi:MAG: undecaprenyl-diphosphate phosphatase [Chloroflexia bacterium]|nr:undecaprenyl-diphosphate phosphatase [Chloroflexia bacterium]
MLDILRAIVLGVVEGLTEFVPVSSTGHLIVAGHLLGYTGEKAATFEIFIQLGAILAVAVLYRERLVRLMPTTPGQGLAGRRGVALLALTTLPALVVGGMAGSAIKDNLFNPTTVAIGWGIGGLALHGVERFRPAATKTHLGALGWRDALVVGLIQCLALWPGVSRAAMTMGSGMLLGADRKTAAEYSFLAAMPVLTAATVFDLYDSRGPLKGSDLPMFAVGFAVAFAAAWIAVRFFLGLLATMTLRPFGWYRIVAATLLLLAISADWVPG